MAVRQRLPACRLDPGSLRDDQGWPTASWTDRWCSDDAVRVSSGNLLADRGYLAFRWAEGDRSEEHTSELQSRSDLVCRLLLEKKKKTIKKLVYEEKKKKKNKKTKK